MSIFKKSQKNPNPISDIINFTSTKLNETGTGTIMDPRLAGKGLGLESMDEISSSNFATVCDNFGIALESELAAITTRTNMQFNRAQRESAKIGAVLASNPIAASKVATFDATANVIRSNQGTERLAMEGYDDRNNKVTARYTVAYNLYAPRQDVFGETLFPTVTIAPDQPGFTTSIDLVYLIDQVRRSVKGEQDKYGRRNVIHALRDPSILRNDATAVIPVFRDSNKHVFVPETVISPSTVRKNGEEITTQPLLFSAPTFSLLGVSQTDLELSVAEQNQTDVLDTAISLKTVYLQVGDETSKEVIAFDVTNTAGSTFNETPQGDDRKMVLNLDLNDLIINRNTKLHGGGALTTLQPIVTGDFMVRLKVQVGMSVLLDISDINAMASPVSVVEVIDQAGQVHVPSSTAVKGIVDLFKNMRLIGYELNARRINSNRRTIAQLLESRIYSQNYAVPTYAPFTVQRPQSAGEQNDTSSVNSLVQAARAMTQAHAVFKLMEADRILSSSIDKRRNIHTVTELMGVSRMIVTPFYEHHSVPVYDTVASLKSHELAADTRAVLVNLLRDVAFRAHRDSGLQQAMDAVYGGAAPRPVVILATDQYIEQYLHVTGDLRTLADKFDVKIVSTPVMEMYGKIFLTFGNFDPALEGQPNPFHFGNMAWRPETVMAFPTYRDGQTSMEITVQPTFLHVVNLPILARIDVTGLSDAMTKKPYVGVKTV